MRGNRSIVSVRVLAPRNGSMVSEPAKKQIPVWLTPLISTLLTLVVATVIGDLGIKNTVVGYASDIRNIQAKMNEDDERLQALLRDLDTLVVSRLNAAEIQSQLSADKNVTGFAGRYPIYYETVQTWTSGRYDVEQRISQYTRCAINVVGCPGYSIFSERSGIDYSIVGETYQSVVEEFRYMNRKITDSLRRPIVACVAAAENLRKTAVAQCQSTKTAPVGTAVAVTSVDLSNCLRDAIAATDADEICPKGVYYPNDDEGTAAFGGDRFSRVRGWLVETKNDLLGMRSRHLREVCQGNQTLLTSAVAGVGGYDCVDATREQLARRPISPESPR